MSRHPQKERAFEEVRSLSERLVARPELVDHLLRLLLAMRLQKTQDESIDFTIAYALSKCDRVEIVNANTGRVITLAEVVTWCMTGHEALRAHLGRFHDLLDAGVERWVSVLGWALVVMHRRGVSIDLVQVTASFEVTGREPMRKLYLMTSHAMQSYVLDVAQGTLPLCMGIVDDIRWPGFAEDGVRHRGALDGRGGFGSAPGRSRQTKLDEHS